jgi:hypothetical protein
MKKKHIILIVFILLTAWLFNFIYTVLLFFGVLAVGYLYALLRYKHLWKDAGELFKDLKKKKEDK